MQQFHSVHDVHDLRALLDRAHQYRKNPLLDAQKGKGRRLGLLFLNPSLRTRISTEVAAQNLGMETIVYSFGSDGWSLEFEDGVVMNGSKAEHIKEAAAVLGRYFDVIGFRTFPGLKDRDADMQDLVFRSMAEYSGVPVISLESAILHPLQSLADLLTIETDWETKHSLTHDQKRISHASTRRPKVVLHWAPHVKPLPQCVANSFSQWVLAWNQADLTIAAPEGYALSNQFTDGAHCTTKSEEALANADYVYVKNWSSFENYGAMPPVSGDWMLNEAKLKTAPEAKIMHCLPVRRNVVLSEELLDGERSLVIKQAENRIYSAQAVLATMLDAL